MSHDHLQEVEQLRDLVSLSLRSFQAVGAAREEVERRYLAGHPAQFPDNAARWAGQLATSDTLEAAVVRFAGVEGVPDALQPPAEAFAARVAGYVTDFVEPAKVAALEDLDEGYRALAIATGWLRGKQGPQGALY